MPKVSALQFHNYTVEELIFKNTPISNSQHEFELHPCFKQNLIDLGEDRYDVRLSVEIDSTVENPMPFHLMVSIVGHFSIQNSDNSMDTSIKDDVLKKNTVAILFPFLRSIVAALTTNANIPTLVLPIMNFSGDN